MSKKSTDKTILQKIGIALFVVALITFTAALNLSQFQLDEPVLREQLTLGVSSDLLDKYGMEQDYYWELAQEELTPLRNQTYGTTFAFNNALKDARKSLQDEVQQDLRENKGLTTSDGDYWQLVLQDYKVQDIAFPVTKASSQGFLPANNGWLLLLIFGVGLLGAFMYILPKTRLLPGIKNDHVYHSKMHYRGWLGIATGVYLIGFYVVLYFFAEHLANWVILVDPISEALRGSPADQWFLYGFLYTLAILVMGVRMIIKYRHNRYHVIRTFSVMFFQLAFAFMIPQILASLNQPSRDLKNIWPLDYSFFFEYNINNLISSGTLGVFMLVWGIALVVIGVPLFSYFYGKRWYCSWVCGCGGLAETLGDPYRQLSDKSLIGWQIERWMVHFVLVFAVGMTGLVLYTYFTNNNPTFSMNRWFFLVLIWLVGGALIYYHRRLFPSVPRRKLLQVVGAVGTVLTIALVVGFINKDSSTVSLSTYQIRSWYGFYIGAGFAGVVGTGFYPFMGNRVWCRFGCPLAAYIGIVQRFKSRFRITANGGQCISCGNCSTYCEMGIDVRWYAQRGQDVIRAACVGCGVCAAVCPRGVLRLENSSEDVDTRAQAQRALHITKNDIQLLS